MDLLIDGCPLQTDARKRGIGRYTSCLLAALQRVRPHWQIQVIEHAGLPPISVDHLAQLPVVRFTAPLPYDLNVPVNYPINDLYFADWLLAKKPDHVLFTSVFEKPGVVPRFTGKRPPTSAIIYDLIPVLFPAQYGLLDGCEGWYGRRFRDLHEMDRLFAISMVTTADTRRLLGPEGPPVSNIRGAVDSRFAPLPADQIALVTARTHEKYGIAPPFLLYVGGEDYRKNLLGAIRAFAVLPSEMRRYYQLVIACRLPPHPLKEATQLADRLGVGSQVRFTGFVADEELIVIYQTCRLFFFPSLYEGLGLPVLEALMCGAPVVCSNCSSMPEFAGNVARLFDPHSPESMAAAIGECLAEPRDRGRADREQFARSFQWDDTAEAVATGIEAGRRERLGRRRIAWVSATHPDARPGRLDSEELLAHLARRLDVEMVLPESARSDAIAHRHLLLAPHEFKDRASAAPFDLCVLNIGPGDPGLLLYDIALRCPFLVVLNHPHTTGYPIAALRPLLRGAAAIAVTSPEMRVWVRTMTDSPVLLPPRVAGPDFFTAAWFEGAIHDVTARIGGTRRWADAAVEALSALPGPPPSRLIEEWAQLRLQAAFLPSLPRVTAAA
jgi:glycosyltransferase involved in cell wall biosynthesis